MINKPLLDELESAWDPASAQDQDKRLSISRLETLPDLYQARPGWETKNGVVDKRHVADLASALQNLGPKADLDPVTVLKVGTRNILIDGHHRLAAYKAKKRKDIPVRWYPHSPKKALIESGRENAKSRLPMPGSARSQRAWTLVCSDIGLSKSAIQLASGASEGTISNMRRKFREYAAEGKAPPDEWLDVLREKWQSDGDFDPGAVKELIAKWAEGITSTFGPATSFRSPSKVEMLADAFVLWSERNAEILAMHLVEALGLEDRIIEQAGEWAEETLAFYKEAKATEEKNLPF